MSTWTTPTTWVNGAVSAATMNTEVRDHLNWLKGFADLITASTAADVGTTTRLSIIRTNATDDILQGKVTGDATQRITINADGAVGWSNGTAAEDARLWRPTAGAMRFDDGSGGPIALQSEGALASDFGSATDEITLTNGFIAMLKRTDPSAPTAGTRLYVRDNGSGKAQLCIRANTGAVGVLWTQP